MAKPIPNILLFTNGRTWSRDDLQCSWRSSDGWEITDEQLAEQPPAESQRLLEALKQGRG